MNEVGKHPLGVHLDPSDSLRFAQVGEQKSPRRLNCGEWDAGDQPELPVVTVVGQVAAQLLDGCAV